MSSGIGTAAQFYEMLGRPYTPFPSNKAGMQHPAYANHPAFQDQAPQQAVATAPVQAPVPTTATFSPLDIRDGKVGAASGAAGGFFEPGPPHKKVNLRDLAPSEFGENNTYVYIKDDGMKYVAELGREAYERSLWRLVLGRPHGQAVFEPMEMFTGDSDTMSMEDVSVWIRFEGMTEVVIDEVDFRTMTGTNLGEAVFDG